MYFNYDEPPIGEHRAIVSFTEHGATWLECRACGATWSESSGQVAEGDGSCTERAAAEDAAIAWGES